MRVMRLTLASSPCAVVAILAPPARPPQSTEASTLTRDIGNVTKDSEVLLEFGMRSKDQMGA